MPTGRFTDADIIEEPQENPAPTLSPSRKFVNAAASRLNPLTMVKGAYDTANALIDDPVGTLASQGPVGSLMRAWDSFKAKDYPGAAASAASALIPGGFMTEDSQRKVAHGAPAEGFGEMTGDAAGIMIGAQIPKVVGKVKSGATRGMEAIKAGGGKIAPSVRSGGVQTVSAGIGELAAQQLGLPPGIGAAIGLKIGEKLAGKAAPVEPPVAAAPPPVEPAVPALPVRVGPQVPGPVEPSLSTPPFVHDPVLEAKIKAAEAPVPWDRSKLPPDPYKQTTAFQRGLADLRARRLGAPEPSGAVRELTTRAVEEAPAAYTNQETTGIQGPAAANRARIGTKIGKWLADNEVTPEILDELKQADKSAYDLFWKRPEIEALSGQRHYSPSEATQSVALAELARLSKIKKASKALAEEMAK